MKRKELYYDERFNGVSEKQPYQLIEEVTKYRGEDTSEKTLINICNEVMGTLLEIFPYGTYDVTLKEHMIEKVSFHMSINGMTSFTYEIYRQDNSIILNSSFCLGDTGCDVFKEALAGDPYEESYWV